MKKTKQFIADKFAEKWLKENKELLDDYTKLASDLLFFCAKWGIEIGFIFKNPEEVKGRELGVGIAEELFDAQKTINNITEYAKTNFREMTPKEKEKNEKKPFFKDLF